MSRTRARLLGLALALSLASAASLANAQGGVALVAIITAEPDASMTRRLRQQLESLGVDVIVLRPPAEGSTARAPLERAARNVGAVAAVRLIPSGEGVEVWVADRVTGKTVVRELIAPSAADPTSDTAIAIGAVELLRASLMELHAPSPPRGDAPVTPQLRALSLPSTKDVPRPSTSVPALSLSLSPEVELGVRGLGPSFNGEMAVWARVLGGFGARAFASLALVPARLTAPEGNVDVTARIFGLEACYDLRAPEERLIPVVGLGAAAAHVEARGAAIPPLTSLTSSTWLGGPFLHVGLGWAFTRGLRLRADALALLTTTAPHVRVTDRDVGVWGTPAALASVGLEILWAP